MFTIRQVEKIMVLCNQVCEEKAVAHDNQNAITPGFKH